MNTALSLRREESRRIVPVAELFAYKANLKKLYRTRAHSGRLNDFFDLAQGYFARGIEQRLTESKCLSNLPTCELVPLRWPGACSRCDGGLIAARKNHHWIWTSCSTGSRGTESNRGYVLRAGQAVRWALKSNPTETAC